jgi:hypothetical protein
MVIAVMPFRLTVLVNMTLPPLCIGFCFLLFVSPEPKPFPVNTAGAIFDQAYYVSFPFFIYKIQYLNDHSGN